MRANWLGLHGPSPSHIGSSYYLDAWLLHQNNDHPAVQFAIGKEHDAAMAFAWRCLGDRYTHWENGWYARYFKLPRP